MADKNMKMLKKLDGALSSSQSEERWKVAAELTEFTLNDPEAIWPLIVKYGSSKDEDLRDQIATCALEHLLEEYFSEFIDRIETLGRLPNPNFIDTLKRCWMLGEAKKSKNAQRVEKILKKRLRVN